MREEDYEPLYSLEQIDEALGRLSNHILETVRETIAERRMKDEEEFVRYNSAQITMLQLIQSLLQKGMTADAQLAIARFLKVLEPLD